MIASHVSAQTPLSMGHRTPEAPRPTQRPVQTVESGIAKETPSPLPRRWGSSVPQRAPSLTLGKSVSHSPSKIPEISTVRCQSGIGLWKLSGPSPPLPDRENEPQEAIVASCSR